MKKIITLLLIVILIAFAKGSWAEDNDPPEGMEVIAVSDGHNILVPKGAKVEKDGGVLKVEGTSEYLLRKINAFEKRLQTNEENYESLKQVLEDIKKEVKMTLDKLNTALSVVESQKQGSVNDLDDLETLVRQLQIDQKDLMQEFIVIKDSLTRKP